MQQCLPRQRLSTNAAVSKSAEFTDRPDRNYDRLNALARLLRLRSWAMGFLRGLSRQCIPGALAGSMPGEMLLFDQAAEVFLQGVAAGSGDVNHIVQAVPVVVAAYAVALSAFM
jgi:hypothetical protein